MYIDDDFNMTKMIIVIGIIACVICLLFSGCKPNVPEIKDYNGQTSACYLADKCMALNSYTEAKQDCSILIQKCMKYVDYEKCGQDKDCYDKIWVKY